MDRSERFALCSILTGSVGPLQPGQSCGPHEEEDGVRGVAQNGQQDRSCAFRVVRAPPL